jgi:aspartyl-tRNA synthetase
MSAPLGSLTRTHTCGALRTADVGADAVLLGWIHRVRDLGGLLFLDVRDRHGVTQVMVPSDSPVMADAKKLRSEYVVAVLGPVRRRDPETVNTKLETGEVEVVAREIRLLNDARTPPIPIADDTPVSEDVRLRYRYLDLRRPRLQYNLGLRHRVTMAIRKYFDANGFWEIETPILGKSTPEGARDYLVPSRVHPGEFFALPQSPQLFKQILMIAGTDRYFQIVKCFRDEDLRADRQPEFTQVDVEISFAHVDLVFGLIEPLIVEVFKEIGVEVPTPFRRMPYAEAMAKYGSDKPDLRFGLEIVDVSHVWADAAFNAFRKIVGDGGAVRALVIPGAARYSRSELDALVDQAKQLGAVGIMWARKVDGAINTNVKAAGEDKLLESMAAASCGPQDLILLAGGRPDDASTLLGVFRLSLAKKENLIPANRYEFAWIVDFPMFEWDATDKRWVPMHHPFTAPLDEDRALLDTDPASARAKAYDLVLNGSEIAGGSIRIHDSAMQSRIFQMLNISDEQAKLRFGFFVDALQYGTPPHGGIALGLDRTVAILAGESSIREVIAFPKTAAAVDLMTGAPSGVDQHQLDELKLRLATPKPSA